jgi:hypothetical protein
MWDKMSKKSRERREKHKAMRPDDYYTNGTIEMVRFGKWKKFKFCCLGNE